MPLDVTDLQQLLREHAAIKFHDISHPGMQTSVHGMPLPTISKYFSIKGSKDVGITTTADSIHPLENRVVAAITTLHNTVTPTTGKHALFLTPEYPTLMPMGGVYWTRRHPDFEHLDDMFSTSGEEFKEQLKKVNEIKTPWLNHQDGVLSPEKVQEVNRNFNSSKILTHLMDFYSSKDSLKLHGITDPKANPSDFIAVRMPDKPSSDAGYHSYLYHPGTEQLFANIYNKE